MNIEQKNGEIVKSTTLLLILLLPLLGLGCAHFHKVESPQEKTEVPEGVKVRIGSPEVKEGDYVEVIKLICNRPTTIRSKSLDVNPSNGKCDSIKVGSTKVIKVLAKDLAIVETPSSFVMEPNMYVEKMKSK